MEMSADSPGLVFNNSCIRKAKTCKTCRLFGHRKEILKIRQHYRQLYSESWLLGLWSGIPVPSCSAICALSASILFFSPFNTIVKTFNTSCLSVSSLPLLFLKRLDSHLKRISGAWNVSPVSAQCCGQHEILRSLHMHSHSEKERTHSRQTAGC